MPTEIPVLAESDDWMVLHKPSGIPVLPGGGFLRNTMLWIVRTRHGALVAPVHRLGRGTSGAILFSRNADAARALARGMREGGIRKTYLALVQGIPAEDVITSYSIHYTKLYEKLRCDRSGEHRSVPRARRVCRSVAGAAVTVIPERH